MAEPVLHCHWNGCVLPTDSRCAGALVHGTLFLAVGAGKSVSDLPERIWKIVVDPSALDVSGYQSSGTGGTASLWLSADGGLPDPVIYHVEERSLKFCIQNTSHRHLAVTLHFEINTLA